MARSHAEQVLSRLVAFGEQVGLGADPERLLDAAVIEAFCRRLRGRAPATKGTYRARLRGLAATAPPARGMAFSAATAPPPYSPAERAELFGVARAQASPTKAASALVLLCAGLGAGLRPAELAVVSASSVETAGGEVFVALGGARARRVRVLAPYGPLLAACATASTEAFLFRPTARRREAKNLVNDFCHTLRVDPAVPRLCLLRCRSSFICDHLAAHTPLGPLCAFAGIVEVESLLRYARHVEGAPQSKAQLRARARREQER